MPERWSRQDAVREPVMKWLLPAYKYLLSFRKREWSLGDYPVRLRRQTTSTDMPAAPPWCARIVNWWLVGLGDSPEEALEDLRRNLEVRRAQAPLPRPGSKPPLKMAPTDQIERHGEFAYAFIERLVGVRPFFISDMTSLGDFCDLGKAEDLHRKVALLYRVDVCDLEGEPLWKVLDRVQRSGGAE